MGEKETGTATEEGERRQHGPGPIKATTVKSSKSNSSERQASGVLSPDTDQPDDLGDEGDGTLDEGPVSIQKQKTKSNQSNDRLGDEDDPVGAGVVQYNESEMEFRQADDGDDPAQTAINNSHSNITNLRSGSGGLDDDGDGVAGVINTTRSNIKSTS